MIYTISLKHIPYILHKIIMDLIKSYRYYALLNVIVCSTIEILSIIFFA